MTQALVIDGLTRRFGGVTALNAVSFTVPLGQTRALIGPNGSGKSTLINCVSAVDRWDDGSITLADRVIKGKDPVGAARRGISRTFQTLRLFDDMTVLENVMVAMHHSRGYGLLAAIALAPKYRAAEKRMREQALELLTLAGIESEANREAGTLPYGHRRLVEIARALALGPNLLLLDEPAAGLNDTETARLAELVTRVARPDLSILVVEHNMEFVSSVASQVTVLDNGNIIAEGTPAEVREHPEVLRAYLGASEDDK
ncbi:ABC-type branched-subunit amino acid transport system ATPase component [Conyzicola lurida]|uniref:ABC-type branched-subunit amino acid transport system ATPase component n=1 Tax=Conyzicola lurida TaxID=1172621 RepID=A0A841AL25_9MICO|nr:ABC transporter ATP-binding protein [Conyzicola lurida]MBB5842175.1 ABC-type branched-subunit amino acid transport system ATPase component [Conyzicola lurida]